MEARRLQPSPCCVKSLLHALCVSVLNLPRARSLSSISACWPACSALALASGHRRGGEPWNAYRCRARLQWPSTARPANSHAEWLCGWSVERIRSVHIKAGPGRRRAWLWPWALCRECPMRHMAMQLRGFLRTPLGCGRAGSGGLGAGGGAGPSDDHEPCLGRYARQACMQQQPCMCDGVYTAWVIAHMHSKIMYVCLHGCSRKAAGSSIDTRLIVG